MYMVAMLLWSALVGAEPTQIKPYLHDDDLSSILKKIIHGRMEHIGQGFCRDQHYNMPWDVHSSCEASDEACVESALATSNLACVTTHFGPGSCLHADPGYDGFGGVRCVKYVGVTPAAHTRSMTHTAAHTRESISPSTHTIGQTFKPLATVQAVNKLCASKYQGCIDGGCCTDADFGCFRSAKTSTYAQCRPMQADCQSSEHWLCPGWERCAIKFANCFESGCCVDDSFACYRRPEVAYAQCRPAAESKACVTSVTGDTGNEVWVCPGWKSCAAALDDCSLSRCCTDGDHMCLKQVGTANHTGFFCRPVTGSATEVSGVDDSTSGIASDSSVGIDPAAKAPFKCVDSDKWLCPSTWKARLSHLVLAAESKFAASRLAQVAEGLVERAEDDFEWAETKVSTKLSPVLSNAKAKVSAKLSPVLTEARDLANKLSEEKQLANKKISAEVSSAALALVVVVLMIILTVTVSVAIARHKQMEYHILRLQQQLGKKSGNYTRTQKGDAVDVSISVNKVLADDETDEDDEEPDHPHTEEPDHAHTDKNDLGENAEQYPSTPSEQPPAIAEADNTKPDQESSPMAEQPSDADAGEKPLGDSSTTPTQSSADSDVQKPVPNQNDAA